MHVPPEQQGSSLDDVERAVEVEAEPIIELQLKSGDDPVFDISRPAPAEEEPPALSFDAFENVKPVAFGGVAAEEDPAPPVAEQPAPEAEPEPETAPEPEPVVER